MLLVLVTGFQYVCNCQLLGKRSGLISLLGWGEKLNKELIYHFQTWGKRDFCDENNGGFLFLVAHFRVTLEQNPIWKLLFLITPPLFGFSSPSYPSAIRLTFGYDLSVSLFFFFASLFLFVYLKSSQPVLTPCSQPSPQPFPFLSNLPLLQRLPLSQSLLSYLSLFHSWLNTFSSPSLVFPLPSNRPSFISIFHSFTVGYIFSYASLFFSLCRLP